MPTSSSHPSQADLSRVLVVVVNYRTPQLTVDCLRSLQPELMALPNLQVCVVDSDSGDDSVNQIQAAISVGKLSERIHLRPLPHNGGFAFGNNAAIRPALAGTSPPELVLLLNPDTVVREGAIRRLLEFMRTRPEIGIVGTRLEDPDGTAQRSAFRFPTLVSELDSTLRLGLFSRLCRSFVVAPPASDVPCRTDWVAGASMMVRAQVFREIGLLDENYFMYFEEVDFCRRASQAGWPCWYLPDSRIVHLVGQSSGVTNPKVRPRRRPGYWFESRRRYFIKTRGRVYALLCDLAFLLGTTLWNVRCRLQRKKNPDPPRLLLDALRHSVFRKGFTVPDASIQ